MTSVPIYEPPPRERPGRRLSTFFYRHPRIRLWALLALPLAWLVLVYFGSLFVLLLSSLWETDPFTREVVHTFTLENFERILETPVFRDVAWRTIQMAVFVTIADAILAFPIAYYMARVASPRTRDLLVVLVLVPLWANYLVKAYAWRTILSEGGVINWALEPFGLHFDGLSTVGLWLVFTYLWLPFMILPIYAGLERIPSSFLEASADLGGRSFTTFTRVILPLAFPAIVAGSIFTFCLTLGDYIAPGLITGEQFIGTVIYSIRSEALPTAAAFSLVPIVVVVAYLLVARRLGAFESASDGRVARHPDPPTARRARDARVHLPAAVIIALYAFNKNITQAWPIEKYSTRWFSVAFNDQDVRDALKNSLLAAVGATIIALVLGTLASMAVARYRFFGREVITFAVILPIALPGIVTGLALQATIIDVLGPLGVTFGLTTIIVGHATFCVVVDLQQRDRADAPHRRARSTRLRPTSAPTTGRRSAT